MSKVAVFYSAAVSGVLVHAIYAFMAGSTLAVIYKRCTLVTTGERENQPSTQCFVHVRIVCEDGCSGDPVGTSLPNTEAIFPGALLVTLQAS